MRPLEHRSPLWRNYCMCGGKNSREVSQALKPGWQPEDKKTSVKGTLPMKTSQGTWPNYDPCRLVTLSTHAGVRKFCLQNLCWGIRCPSRANTVFNKFASGDASSWHMSWPLVLNGWSTSGSTWGRVVDLLTLRWRAYENPTPTKIVFPQCEHQKINISTYSYMIKQNEWYKHHLHNEISKVEHNNWNLIYDRRNNSKYISTL